MDEKLLNELLECSVCLERLDQTSKVLPCQHTFCRRCLSEIVATKRELRCPECRSLVDIPVEDLPTNILLVRLLEGLKTKSNIRWDTQDDSFTTKNFVEDQPRAKALYNYEGKDGDLSFKKGDMVFLKKMIDENWFLGELNGHSGIVPASYVQVIVNLPLCKALFDFDVNETEKDCLRFKKEEWITVIKKVDANWLEGRKGDKIGIFPISFVEMNDAAKSLVDVKSRHEKQASSHSDTASPVDLSAQLASQLPQQKRHSFTAALPSTANKYQHRRSLELSGSASPMTDRPVPLRETSVSAVGGAGSGEITNQTAGFQRLASPEDRNYKAGARPSAIPLRTNSQISTEVDRSKKTTVYVSLYNYKPKKEDEIELKKGDYYTVMDKCQDGWFRGRCLRTGKSGVFPGNYVQPVTSLSGASGTSLNPGILNIRAKDSSSTTSKSSSSSSSNGGASLVTGSKAAVTAASVPQSLPLSSSSISSETSANREGRSPVKSKISPPRALSSPGHRSKSFQNSRNVPGNSSSGLLDMSVVSGAMDDIRCPPPGSQSYLGCGNQSSQDKSQEPRASSRRSSHSFRRAEKNYSNSHSHGHYHHHHHHHHHHHLQQQNTPFRTTPTSTSSHISSSSSSTSSKCSSQFKPPVDLLCGDFPESMHKALGATSSSSQGGTPGEAFVANTSSSSFPGKDKKEKKERDRLGLMKRLTSGKSKKSKVPASNHEETPNEQLLIDFSSSHVRSGSCPSNTSSTSTCGSSGVLNHVKTASFDSSLQPSLPLPEPLKPKRPTPPYRERYRCIIPYPPNGEAELALGVGDIVSVSKKREDGWFRGTHQRTGKTGLFPRNFVEKID